MPDGNTAKVLSFVDWSELVTVPVSMKPLSEILRMSGLRCLDLNRFNNVRHSILKEDFFKISFAKIVSSKTNMEQLCSTLFCCGRRPPLLREFILAYMYYAKTFSSPAWVCLTPLQEENILYFPIINENRDIFFVPMIGKIRKDSLFPVVCI